MAHLRSDLPRLLVESLLIIFSIVLGFGLNEWRAERAREALGKKAVERFRYEIEYNRQSVAERVDYHRSVSARVAVEVENGVSAEEPLLALFARVAPQGVQPPDLRDTAWESAVASRALEEIDYDLLFVVATVYRAQEAGVATTWPQLVRDILKPENFNPEQRAPLLSYMGMAFSELALQEEALLSVYDFAIEVLDGKRDPVDARDSLSRSRPPSSTAESNAE